ncbi:aminotransferase class IV [Chitinophaga sp. GCM10012297]|uniref:branched-chain-amino-acid transaminase n=1 Tax=Chitinophaga chungangae TaxID=2821488 RepID=A0ABS3Y7H1_9BACT|nr:aminotransferase class IV [Chitinophaga chungangae]MBO9150630.1 aminotransferase class IV [Chitinophaga chungangae]
MQLCYNGKFMAGDKPLLTVDNRSFRYGDGCFETMKVYQGQLLLADLHFERLIASLHLLHFHIPAHFTKDYFTGLIRELCRLNSVSELARVRLTVWRAGTGLYDPVDHTPHFIIQCWELPEHIFELNSAGLLLDVFPDVVKSCDKISSVKSNNCLPYVLAALYAKQHQVNETVLLNQHGRVADTTIANIFIVRNSHVYTPPLTEGGVCGVMRKYLLQKEFPFRISEQPLSVKDLQTADEIFLTNAIFGIRWVGRFRNSSYGNATAAILHEMLFESML